MKTTLRFLPFLCLVLLVGSCKDSSQKEEPAWEQTPVSGVRMVFDRPKMGCVPILSDSGCLFFRLHRSESHTVALYRIQGDSLLFLQEILPKGGWAGRPLHPADKAASRYALCLGAVQWRKQNPENRLASFG